MLTNAEKDFLLQVDLIEKLREKRNELESKHDEIVFNGTEEERLEYLSELGKHIALIRVTEVRLTEMRSKIPKDRMEHVKECYYMHPCRAV